MRAKGIERKKKKNKNFEQNSPQNKEGGTSVTTGGTSPEGRHTGKV